MTTILKPIELTEIAGVRIGNAQNEEAKTGVTVVIFEEGAKVGVDVSGGGPASRETPLASPITADNPVNAICLSGGSAFGLAASDGVMRYLEERKMGYDTGFAYVPLVLQSCIFDLGLGSSTIRPDSAMGYEACVNAEKNIVKHGNIGAGCGATVGKILGMEQSTKTGLGVAAVSVGGLQMAAVVALNALGDIFDPTTGTKIAGLKNPEGDGFLDTCEQLYQISAPTDLFQGNTTIGIVITNGDFSKAEMNKIAAMTRNAYGRCINPVGTMADGDTIYAACTGKVKADVNMAGTLAAKVMEMAIIDAVNSAKY
ncbi:MAG: P1 family peptidase [Lachnospiraceae bacterium]|nr:P1 family peptidase [Lachnospiraceae bacterium]